MSESSESLFLGKAVDSFCAMDLPNALLCAGTLANTRATEHFPVLFSLQHNCECHKPEHCCLQPGIFAQEDRHVAHKRHVAQHTANDVLLAVEEALAAGVELGVICCVVVALGQEL